MSGGLDDEGLLAAAAEAIGVGIGRARRIGGGDINEAWALELDDGSRAFLKSRPDAPADEYGAEAAGLRWLAEPGGLPVPEVIAVIGKEDSRGLVLEWVEPGRLSAAGEEELGRGLAITHAAGAETFDALPPGSPRKALRFGGVEIPLEGAEARDANGEHAAPAGWERTYARRLERLAAVASERGRIGASCARAVEVVAGRITELAGPEEPAARVHGDLWSGNVLAGADGRPWLIDPAAHGGHREMDLAMLELFGAVSRRTLAAYEEIWPLAAGWEERVGLWQLQPLLVHAILFGGSYGAAAERAATRYG